MKAFSLAGAEHLPVTGDIHPLRKEFARWVSWANAVVLITGVALFAGWYFWSHRDKVELRTGQEIEGQKRKTGPTRKRGPWCPCRQLSAVS